MTNSPTPLYFRGEFLRDAMRRQRVTEAEVQAAVRKRKFGSMDDIEAVVMELSGELSVPISVGDGSALGKQIQQFVRRQTAENSDDTA